MLSPVVFWAWQNDRPRVHNRDFIRAASALAIIQLGQGMLLEDSPRLDHDTENESGTPAISETIFRKISQSAVFIADVTFCWEDRDKDNKVKKRIPNPNVMVELGYAAAIMGWSRIVLVMNKHYGSAESLPFDLRNHRFPVTYKLGPESKKGDDVFVELVAEIKARVQACLMAEYDLVESTLTKMSSHGRSLMKETGLARGFTEQEITNKLLTRVDLAIAQMLDLGMIRCVDAISEKGFEYVWTYLGKQCCYKLGVVPPPVSVPSGEPPQQIVVNSYLDGLKP